MIVWNEVNIYWFRFTLWLCVFVVSHVPTTPVDPTRYINKMYPTSMSVYLTDCSEILNVVQRLETSSSIDYDRISHTVAKGVLWKIYKPLSEIFNMSFNSGEFPDKLKIAKVVPVYKSDDKLTVSNYRPISAYTHMALLKLVDQVTDELNNKKYSTGIFVDLSKAFDTIDYKILINNNAFFLCWT